MCLARVAELEQQLEAEPGGRVGAGAERLAGVDDDGIPPAGRSGSRGSAPALHQDGRTTIRPPAIETGWWKSRQRSAQSSGISVELISTRPSPAAASSSGSAGSSPGGPVDRVLHPLAAALLLDPARGELEQVGEHALGELGAAADGEPDQAAGWSPPSDSCRRSASLRCSRLSLRGTTTSTSTCSSPRCRAAQRRQPEAVERHRMPGLGPGRDRDLAVAVERRRRDARRRSSPASPAPRPP